MYQCRNTGHACRPLSIGTLYMTRGRCSLSILCEDMSFPPELCSSVFGDGIRTRKRRKVTPQKNCLREYAHSARATGGSTEVECRPTLSGSRGSNSWKHTEITGHGECTALLAVCKYSVVRCDANWQEKSMCTMFASVTLSLEHVIEAMPPSATL